MSLISIAIITMSLISIVITLITTMIISFNKKPSGVQVALVADLRLRAGEPDAPLGDLLQGILLPRHGVLLQEHLATALRRRVSPIIPNRK